MGVWCEHRVKETAQPLLFYTHQVAALPKRVSGVDINNPTEPYNRASVALFTPKNPTTTSHITPRLPVCTVRPHESTAFAHISPPSPFCVSNARKCCLDVWNRLKG